MEVAAEPWEHYTRSSLRSGWTYPCGQTQIREALQSADASVRYLSLGGGYEGSPYGTTGTPRPHSLVRAWWSTATNPLRRVTTDEKLADGWAGLDVYAVPNAQAADARARLAGGLLLEAVKWLTDLRDGGNAWRASDHELVLFLGTDGISRQEI